MSCELKVNSNNDVTHSFHLVIAQTCALNWQLDDLSYSIPKDNRPILAIPLLLIYNSIPLKSQEQEKNTVGSWMVLSMNNQISEMWSVPVVGILYYENGAAQTEFGFIRTGLTYRFNPKLRLTLGGAYVDLQPLEHNNPTRLTTLLWIYEQGTITTGNAFNHRLQLEHHWVREPGVTRFSSRLRYCLRYHISITPRLYFTCGDEPFLNLNTLRMDQNRLLLGVGQKLSQDVATEAGFFKTHVVGTHLNRIRVALHLKTDFFKSLA